MNPTTRSAWLRLPYVLLVSSLAVVPTSDVLSEDSEQEKSVKKLYQFAWTPSERAAAGEAFWPQFRGPQGDGSAFDAKPPTEWSETKNLVWKTAIHGQAWSSPVVWKDRIWMTTATADGKTMSAICCDLNTGKTLLDRVVFTNQEVQKDHHATNSYSSPTPVMDSERVYLHWGAYGTAALDAKTGATLWERRDLPCNHYRGPGSSPILFGNLLIFNMDGYDFKYVVALDKSTGKTVWKVDRDIDYGTADGDVHKAYTTPTLITTPSGIQLVSASSKATIAYDPFTGKDLWRVRYNEYSTTARPVFDGERVYLNSGFSKSHLLAVRPGKPGDGDITKTNVDWEVTRAISCKPSHSIAGDWIFSIEDKGILTCLLRKDGSQVWQERLGGDFSSSPIIADGKIYLFDHNGSGYVYLADGSKTLVAKNTLEDGCRASPVAIGKKLIVRTVSSLYCFEQK
ncbi:MAG: PQQ-binding-like beta-propeller repeat protein [Pirellulales bacterium]